MLRGAWKHIGVCLESRFLPLELLTVYWRSLQTIGSNLWVPAFIFASLPCSNELSDDNRISLWCTFVSFDLTRNLIPLPLKEKQHSGHLLAHHCCLCWFWQSESQHWILQLWHSLSMQAWRSAAMKGSPGWETGLITPAMALRRSQEWERTYTLTCDWSWFCSH